MKRLYQVAAVGIAVLGVGLWGFSYLGAKAPQAQTPALGTDDQRAAEKVLLALADDPEIKAAQVRLREELKATPTGQSADGGARLERDLRLWTNSLILREAGKNAPHPSIVWAVDNTPHSWFGYEITGSAVAGDNPDHIYRGVALDGAGVYEITGQVDGARRPAQFSFEVNRDLPLQQLTQIQSTNRADLGTQVAMLTDRDIKIGADGGFRITIGGAAEGPNHLASVPSPISVTIRDVLSDWNQVPNRLTIRRLDQADPKPEDAEAVKRQVIQNLPDYVRFWSAFKDTWFGGLKPNTVSDVKARDGGWGFLAGAYYKLAPGEAAVITTTRGSARYTGIQVTDPWMVAPDGAKHQASINISQAKPNADGTYTYVISPQDPGVANWLDTAGLQEGYAVLRWQGFETPSTGEELLRGFRVVKLEDLAQGKLEGVPLASSDERHVQLAKRRTEYAVRTGS